MRSSIGSTITVAVVLFLLGTMEMEKVMAMWRFPPHSNGSKVDTILHTSDASHREEEQSSSASSKWDEDWNGSDKQPSKSSFNDYRREYYSSSFSGCDRNKSSLCSGYTESDLSMGWGGKSSDLSPGDNNSPGSSTTFKQELLNANNSSELEDDVFYDNDPNIYYPVSLTSESKNDTTNGDEDDNNGLLKCQQFLAEHANVTEQSVRQYRLYFNDLIFDNNTDNRDYDCDEANYSYRQYLAEHAEATCRWICKHSPYFSNSETSRDPLFLSFGKFASLLNQKSSVSSSNISGYLHSEQPFEGSTADQNSFIFSSDSSEHQFSCGFQEVIMEEDPWVGLNISLGNKTEDINETTKAPVLKMAPKCRRSGSKPDHDLAEKKMKI